MILNAGSYGNQDGWLKSLERHLEEQLGRSGVAADAVARLQQGGVREEALRGDGAERLLRELAVPVGVRRAILARYGGGGGGDTDSAGWVGSPFPLPRLEL